MRWYGALVEIPGNSYVGMFTDFEGNVRAFQLTESRTRKIVDDVLREILSGGHRVTLVIDRIFVPFGEKMEVWRELVQRYSADAYETFSTAFDRRSAYRGRRGVGRESFYRPISVVLVEPGTFAALYYYRTGQARPPDSLHLARIGCAVAANETLLCIFRSQTPPPSSQDILSVIRGSTPMEMVVGEDILWLFARGDLPQSDVDPAMLGLKFAEIEGAHRHLRNRVGVKLAALCICKDYRVAVGAACLGYDTAQTLSISGPKKAPNQRPRTRLAHQVSFPVVGGDQPWKGWDTANGSSKRNRPSADEEYPKKTKSGIEGAHDFLLPIATQLPVQIRDIGRREMVHMKWRPL